MKQYKREVDRAIRELDRERRKLETQNEKIARDIKKAAKDNQMVSVQSVACACMLVGHLAPLRVCCCFNHPSRWIELQAVVKIMAKDYVRSKKHVAKFMQLRTWLQGIGIQLQVSLFGLICLLVDTRL